MITYGGQAATTPDELFYCQQKPDAVSYFKHRGLCSRAWIRIRMVAVWQFSAWLYLFAFSPLCTCAPEYSLSVWTRKLSSLAVSALELGSFNGKIGKLSAENSSKLSSQLLLHWLDSCLLFAEVAAELAVGGEWKFRQKFMLKLSFELSDFNLMTQINKRMKPQFEQIQDLVECNCKKLLVTSTWFPSPAPWESS